MKNRRFGVCLLFLSTAILLFSGCSVKYEAESIRISHERSSSKVIELSEEDVDKLLGILNSGEWKDGVTKTYCQCIFSMEDTEIEYSYESGLFRDEENNRTLFLNDEQKVYVNSLVDDLYGIKQDSYIPGKLKEIYEIKNIKSSVALYNNPINDEVVYSTEKTVGSSEVIKVDNKDYGLKYECTMYYPLDNIKVHKYTVDGDEDGIVLLKDDGSLFSCMNTEFVKNINFEKSEEWIISGIVTYFDKLIDSPAYDYWWIEGPVTEQSQAFGLYKIILRNEIQGYVVDHLTIHVSSDGVVTDLWHTEKGIAKEDVSIEIDKTLVDDFLDKKVSQMYSSSETEIRGYSNVGVPELKKYNDEICAFYTLECGLYDKTADKEYVEKCKLLIPIRLLAKDN